MNNSDKTFANFEEYIAQFPLPTQQILKDLRELVLKEAPDAVESISYGMPAFKLNGKPLAYFAGWEKHIGFYPTPSGTETFAEELSGYKGGKGSVQFPLDKPMPMGLIKRIVQFRAGEIRKK